MNKSDPTPWSSKKIWAFERMSASVAETCKMSRPAGESSGTLSLYRDWGTDGARGKSKRGKKLKGMLG